MSEIAPLVRRPIIPEPDQTYQEIGVRSFGKGIFHKPPSTSLSIGDKKIFRIEPGDLVFNIVFAWEGAVAVAGDEERGTVGSHRFLTCVVDPGLASASYLYWYFIHQHGLKQLQLASPGGAGRNRTLGIDKLEAIAVELPPVSEQRKLASRLAQVASAGKAAKSRAASASSEANTAVKSAFASIVSNAPRVRLGDIAPLVRRTVEIDSAATYTEIGVRSFFRGLFHRRSITGAEFTWQKLFRIAKDDLVFSNLMAWEQAIALAGARDDGCVGNHRMLTCQVDRSKALPMFVWYYFTTPVGFAQVVSASPGSIARNKTLSTDMLPNIEVPVPSLDAQLWFESLQTKSAEIGARQQDVASELDKLMPAMLHDAFG